MTKSVILDLMQRLAEDVAARAAQAEVEKRRNAVSRRLYAEALLPEAQAVLGPLAAESDIFISNITAQAVTFRVLPHVWHGLVGFDMAKTDGDDLWNFLPESNFGRYWVSDREDWTNWWASGLAGLHREFEKKRDARIKDALKRLSWADTADDEAMRCRLDLIDLVPEREDEWEAAFTEWVKRRDAQAAAEAERAAAFDAYIAAVAAWRREYEQTLEANRQAVRDIQIDLDAEFTRFEVAYTAVGDEDDYPYEARAWTLDEFPDERGYRRFFEDGRVARRKLMRALWIGEPITQRVLGAGSGPWRIGVYAAWTGTFVYCLPWDAVTARNLIDQYTKPLPEQPAAWSFDGDSSMTAGERRRIGEALDGMESFDLPF